MKKLLLLLRAIFPALMLTFATLGAGAAMVGCGDSDFEDAGEEIDEGIDEVEDELD